MSSMTEDEAKTKWCPFVRHVFEAEDGGGFNRISTPVDTSYNLNCVGSDCMMWRWGASGDCYGFRKPDGTDHYTPTQDGLKKAKDAGWPELGYCGLARQP